MFRCFNRPMQIERLATAGDTNKTNGHKVYSSQLPCSDVSG